MSSGEPHGEGLCFAYLHEAIQIGPDARSSAQGQIERSDAEWKLTQILLDSDEHRGWHMRFRIHLAASREAAALCQASFGVAAWARSSGRLKKKNFRFLIGSYEIRPMSGRLARHRWILKLDRPNSAIIDLVEASYNLEVGGDQWLPQMLEAGLPIIDQGLGVMGVTGTRPPEGSPIIQHHHLHVASGPQDLPMRHLKAMSEAPPEKVYDHTRPGMATTLSELTEDDPWMLDIWVRNVDYAKDALTLSAIDPDGRGIVILAPLAEVKRLTPPERRRWRMVGAHLSAGHRLRRAIEDLATRTVFPTGGLPFDADAVLDSKGFKITELTENARGNEASEVLREAARRVDRARGSLRKQDPGEALETWKGLVSGRWSMVDWFDSDRRRFVLAIRNPPGVGDPRGLNERESQVAAYAALGESSKLIRYRLGLSATQTSMALRSAMRKLGAKTQAQLVEKMRGLPTLQSDAEHD